MVHLVAGGPVKRFPPDYRYVSALPALGIPDYQTADARIAYQVRNAVELSANGHNLPQPRHREYPGDNSNAVYIRRDFYGELRWTW